MRNPDPEVILRVSDSSMILRAELPGFPRENLSLEVDGRRLILRGRRPEGDVGVPVRLERRTGDFELGIPIPEGLDPSRMIASLKDGVLEVSCPLGTTARKIHVAPGGEDPRALAPGSLSDAERKERK
jgi:HSP20 family protein